MLVEFLEGDIVTDIEAFSKKALPELDKLTPNEIKMLQVAYKVKKFTVEELIKKGLPLQIENEVKSLEKKGYLLKSGNSFAVSERYVLSQLANHAFYGKIEFSDVQYHIKPEPRISIDSVKEKLSRFTTIVDQRECYIIKHDKLMKSN